MSVLFEHMAWVAGYTRRSEGILASTWVADYQLSHLMERGFIDRRAAHHFLDETGLADFAWSITWPEDFELPDEMLVARLADVQGYVIFIHGWTGNRLIWEELPGMVVSANRQLVSITVDHNGFGLSSFVDKTPSLDSCNPPAAMRAMQMWIDLMKLRRAPGASKPKVINLVGHSMGGAMLFYLNPMLWNYGEVTRFALAPALLLEDDNHRIFYTTLGLGIGILQRVPVLEIVERFIKPSMLETLVAGASTDVKKFHSRQYDATPRGITGATFMAMGRLNNFEIAHDFKTMRVMLGHRDPLVGLTDMIDLLMKLEFPAGNLHVVPGTHYLFSLGSETTANTFQHTQNRDLAIEDILQLHAEAYRMQKDGRRFG